MGRAMALGLAREGVSVFIAEVRRPEGEKVLKEIQDSGGRSELFVGNIAQKKTAEEAVNDCVRQLGGLHILVNNAGLRMEEHQDGVYESWRCVRMRPTHELPVEDWDLLLTTNLRGVFLCTHFALPAMIQQKRGTIISITSSAGTHGIPGKSAYSASKHAVEGLMKTVAEEGRDHGISANSIHPGGRVNVDGRGGVPPEVIVPLVLFLSSQDRPVITGQTIRARDWNEGKVASAMTSGRT